MKQQLRALPITKDKQPFSNTRLESEGQLRFRELYLFQRINYRCPAISSLWGIFNDYKEGRLFLESDSRDLWTFRHWHIVPEEYRYCRRASRHELRDYISGLIYNECHTRLST
ncbi:hypothetical protein [Alistipes sp.]|uniref:hypothetical protein n=1 Tax=Alistipes sp. TaxID=1872444 RepID=UPI003AB5D4D3